MSRDQVALHDLQLYGKASGLSAALALPGFGESGIRHIRAMEGLSAAGGTTDMPEDDLSSRESASVLAPDPR